MDDIANIGLDEHLNEGCDIDADNETIERWVSDEYIRVTNGTGATYEAIFAEAIYGQGHKDEHAALQVALLREGTTMQDRDALYMFRRTTESWLTSYLVKKAGENRKQILDAVKYLNDITLDELEK